MLKLRLSPSEAAEAELEPLTGVGRWVRARALQGETAISHEQLTETCLASW